MTRKPRTPVIRGMVQRGDGPWVVHLGPRTPFVADPSQAPRPTLADRYSATATGQPPDVDMLTVRDDETGATASKAKGDDVLVLTVPVGAPDAVGTSLLKAAREILALDLRPLGGPATGTGLQPSQITPRV